MLLLTGNQLRHSYAARELARSFHLVGVVSEEKPTAGSHGPATTDEDRAIIKEHFQQRDRVEQALLGNCVVFPDVPVRRLPTGAINSEDVRSWVGRLNPDFILLYGTSLIRQPLLGACASMINIHLGLSPWYRGSGTNFWPFVLNEPQCVGATIHMAVEEVDAGPILAQVRPAWQPSDGMHEAGTKTLMAAVAILPAVIDTVATGKIYGERQDLSEGRVFRQKDFTADAVRTARRNLADGMIGEYLAQSSLLNDRYPIMELGARAVSK